MRLSDDLLLNFQHDRVHLFVGSGVSAAASLTKWEALIVEMKEILQSEWDGGSEELEKFFKRDNYDIADGFKTSVGPFRYFQFLRRHYRREVALSGLHSAIGQLPVRTIYTTNYDKLLERTFRSAQGYDPSVITRPEQLGYIDESEVRIIKMHGDIDHPDTLVLTRQDYSGYQERHEDFIQIFAESLNNDTVLFLGCSLKDENTRRIYYDARRKHTTKRPAYALMTNTDTFFRDMWRRDGLIIIPADSYDEVPRYLEEVHQELVRRKTP